MKKRIFTTFLSVMMLFGVVGCNNGGTTDSSDKVTAIRPVTQDNVHYIEGTLHKVNVTESSKPFVVNGVSEYKIVYAGDALANKAASFIYRNVKKATGASLPIVNSSDEIIWNNNQKLIVINDTELFQTAGLAMPTDDLGLAGYYIKTVGNSVFIMTVDEFGCQHAAIAFLRHVLGFDVIASDLTVYEKTGETLPNMDIVEKPDIDMTLASYAIDAETEYGMGVTNNYLMNTNGATVHNVFEILPKDKWQNKFPNWYSLDGTQLCYNARGNEEDRKAMQNEVVKVLKQTILDSPTQRLVTVTDEDIPSQCMCSVCKEKSELYGTSAGSIIPFMNDVDDEIQAWIKEENLGRQITIMFFAYNKSYPAPAKQNEAGEWEPIDESVICNDTLGVYIAPIDTKYTESIYHEDNINTYNQIQGWKACAKKFYFWMYDTNFRNYMYPFETWDAIMESYRYIKSAGAIGARSQGQNDQGSATTAFHEFKKYLLAKATFDVNANYNDIVDHYFKHYFGDAEQPMRQMFDEIRAYMAWLTATYNLPGTLYETIEVQEYWPKRLLDGWLQLIDEAYEKIEHYRTSDPEYYAVLERHIRLESLFPRFALIRLHAGSYSAPTYTEMQKTFRDDIVKFGITRNVEHGSFEDLFAEWGI